MRQELEKKQLELINKNKDQLLFTGSTLRRTENFLYEWQVEEYRKRLNSNKLELLIEEKDFLKNEVVQKIFRKMNSLANNSIGFIFFKKETIDKFIALVNILHSILDSLSENESDEINYEQLSRDVEKAVSDNENALSVVRFPNFLKDLFELIGITFSSSKSEAKKLCSDLIEYIKGNPRSDKNNNLEKKTVCPN